MSHENEPHDGPDGSDRVEEGRATEGPGTDAGRDEGPDRAQALDKREERLDQREMGLDSRADQLDEREAELDERESQLDDRHEDLAKNRERLQQREASIEQREADLDEREEAARKRERELAEREDDLDRKEETLEAFVGDNVESAVASAMSAYTGSRQFGPVGGLVVGLAGLVLVAAGVANGVATQSGSLPALLGGTTGDLILSAALVLAGLAGNLAAATDRV
jgi:septal ring factor EnvC (AmiA/AmiB activator)